MKTKPIQILARVVCFMCLAMSQKGMADALDNWTTNQVTSVPVGFRGSILTDIAYGSGRFVAVGSYSGDDNGLVLTSEDGLSWTTRTSLNYSILNLYDVTFGSGTFVAVGWDYYNGANIYSSTNGINWSPHATKISNFYGVAYGGGSFVAVGDGYLLNSFSATNRNIYTSPDGITWTGRNSGSPANDVHSISDVTYGSAPNRFVAVDAQGYVYTATPPGITWTRTFVGHSGTAVNYCNDRFFIPSGAGTNYVSTTGLSWFSLTNNTAATFRRVIYGNNLFIAGSGSKLFTSTDGTNWIQRGFPTQTNLSLSSLCFGTRNLVAAGTTLIPGSSFNTYAPSAYASDPFAAMNIVSGLPPQLSVSGLLGRFYRIEFLDNVRNSTNNWQTLATISLTNSPQLWTDSSATNAQRYYRAALLP